MSETRVRLPDGTYVNVPTSDTKQATAAARRYWDSRKKAAPATPKKRSFMGTLSDMAGDFIDNVTPNWGDEVHASGAALGAVLTGQPLGATFRQAQKDYHRKQKRYAKEHPRLKAGTSVGGMAAGIFLPASQALKGGTMLQKVTQSGKVGALYGALAGAGKGDGADLSTRATNAAVDGATGGLVGGAMPVAMNRLGAMGRWSREHVPGVDASVRAVGRARDALTGRASDFVPAPVQQAYRLISDRMRDGNMGENPAIPSPQATPQRIAREVERRNQVNVPAIVGDTTQPMRDLTQWAGRGMGPGQTLVRRTLDERKAREAARVRQHVNETMPTTNDPIAYVEEAKSQARTAAGPLYEQAYSQPMYRTPPIQAIEQTPAFRQAVPQAHQNISNQIDEATGLPKNPEALGFRYFDGDPSGLPPTTPYFPLPERGYVTMDQGLSTEGYDQVIRAMSDNGRAASFINPVTGRIESTTNSVHINNRARDLRRELMDQNDPYRQAVEDYGDDMAMVDGFNNGRDVGKLTGHEINAQRRAMPDAAMGPWSTAAGTAMADEASAYGAKFPNGATANRVRQMLGDDTKQAAISEMTGNTGGVRQLLDRLEYEQQGHLTWNGLNGNSATAARQALDDDLGNAIGDVPRTATGWINHLAGSVASRMAPRYRNQVKEAVAEIMTLSQPRSVQEAIEAIEAQAQRDERFADLLHTGAIGTSALAGMTIEPVTDPDNPDQYEP